jgi:hypothetical protein
MMPKPLSVDQLLPKFPLLPLDKIEWPESTCVLEGTVPKRGLAYADLKLISLNGHESNHFPR